MLNLRMQSMLLVPAIAVLAVFGLAGCSRTQADDTAPSRSLVLSDEKTIGDPQRNPADPYLQTAPDGSLLLSWTEQEPGAKDDGRNFLIASLDRNGEVASEIRRMNDQPGQLSSHGGENLAKFTVNAENGIAAVWTTRGEDYHTGDLWYSHGEKTGPFSPAARLNDDESSQWNHTFSAITTGPDGRIYAAWMDGRNRKIVGYDNTDPNKKNKRVYEWDNSQLMMSVSEDGGRSWGPNYPISDFRICSCCRPTIEFLDGGETMVISYRLVADDYLRDQVLVRSTDGARTFSEPVYISEDGWINESCPHAGPSIDVDSRDTIHSLWWTAGRVEDEAGIYYTTSTDGGRSFAPRHLISRTPAKTVLHAQLVVDAQDTVWAAWEEVKDDHPQIFLAYREAGSGEWSESIQLSDGTRNAVFPVLARDGERIQIAWTERKGETTRVKTRSVTRG